MIAVSVCKAQAQAFSAKEAQLNRNQNTLNQVDDICFSTLLARLRGGQFLNIFQSVRKSFTHAFMVMSHAVVSFHDYVLDFYQKSQNTGNRCESICMDFMCPINLSPGFAFGFCRQFLQKCLGDDFGSDPETLGIQSQPFLRSVGGNLCEGLISKGEPSSDEDEDEVLAKRSRQKLQVG